MENMIIAVKKFGTQWLSASDLHFISQLLQNAGDLFALFAMDFDDAILDRSTCAAFLF